MGYVYVASPYTCADPGVSEGERKWLECRRYQQVFEYVKKRLEDSDETFYSPIVYSHPLAVSENMPATWEFWSKHCFNMLVKADKLLVLKMPVWEQSKGVVAEIDIAEKRGIPVEYAEWEG